MERKEIEFTQFNLKQREYSDFVGADPVRNYLQYPAIISEMGDIRGKNILDVGCGDGYFARMLSREYGAEVVGYDRGEQLIHAARETAKQEGFTNIQFFVADAQDFKIAKSFDFGVSVMVLPYAPNETELAKYFESTRNSLNIGGKFISVVLNPELKKYEGSIPNRKMIPLGNRKIEVHFFDPKSGTEKFTGVLNQFSKDAYNTAARKGGFAKMDWRPVYPSEAAMKDEGNFWKNVVEDQPYSLLVAEK